MVLEVRAVFSVEGGDVLPEKTRHKDCAIIAAGVPREFPGVRHGVARVFEEGFNERGPVEAAADERNVRRDNRLEGFEGGSQRGIQGFDISEAFAQPEAEVAVCEMGDALARGAKTRGEENLIRAGFREKGTPAAGFRFLRGG